MVWLSAEPVNALVKGRVASFVAFPSWMVRATPGSGIVTGPATAPSLNTEAAEDHARHVVVGAGQPGRDHSVSLGKPSGVQLAHSLGGACRVNDLGHVCRPDLVCCAACLSRLHWPEGTAGNTGRRASAEPSRRTDTRQTETIMTSPYTYQFDDRLLGPIEITGTLVGQVNTRDGAPGQKLEVDRLRWAKSTVIRLAAGTYVLITEAFSIIYHRAGNPVCRNRNQSFSGDEGTAAEMAAELERVDFALEDAEPCYRCHPMAPAALGSGTKIRYEFPRRKVYQCESGHQVAERLMMSRTYGGAVSNFLPKPARDLLEQCRENDPAFLPEGGRVVTKIA